MSVNDLVLVQGLHDTRATLRRWILRPWPVLRTWLIGSVLVAVGLLAAMLLVAALSTPDPSGLALPGVTRRAHLGDALFVLYRNSLVLALHAFACVAGFIAGSSLPLTAEKHTGFWRWVHAKAGPLAIAFVVGATTFSLATQAYVLGQGASTAAAQLHVSQLVLVLGLAPHALPELTALFLPLAAWVIASRRNEWHELLAATFVTVAIAAPVLMLSAFVEVFVSPRLLLALSG